MSPKVLLNLTFHLTGWWDVVGSHKIPQIICIHQRNVCCQIQDFYSLLVGTLTPATGNAQRRWRDAVFMRKKCSILGASQLDGSGCLCRLTQRTAPNVYFGWYWLVFWFCMIFWRLVKWCKFGNWGQPFSRIFCRLVAMLRDQFHGSLAKPRDGVSPLIYIDIIINYHNIYIYIKYYVYTSLPIFRAPITTNLSARHYIRELSRQKMLLGTASPIASIHVNKMSRRGWPGRPGEETWGKMMKAQVKYHAVCFLFLRNIWFQTMYNHVMLICWWHLLTMFQSAWITITGWRQSSICWGGGMARHSNQDATSLCIFRIYI